MKINNTSISFRALSAASFFFVTISMMAQKSFILTGKNSNSQFVENIFFQQQTASDHFSWGTSSDVNGYQKERDISDLLYIARTNRTLTTGSSDEVSAMLEQLCTEQADAQAIAEVLKENSNIDWSFSSEDSQSLIVKYKDNNTISTYPVTQYKDPFDDETEDANSSRVYESRSAVATPQYRVTGRRGKVAVFNYFSNQITRKTQNKMLEYMMQDLNNHNYGVEYYPYEKMTVDNLKKVINTASSTDDPQYTAVIIISHGFTYGDNSYFVIGEEFDENNYNASYRLFIEDDASQSEGVSFSHRFWNEGIGAFGSGARYDCAINVNKVSLNSGVILYMGACDAYAKGRKSGTCIGWSGDNVTAQAHVTLLFYNLMRGKSLADALDKREEKNPYYEITRGHPDTWKKDPITDAEMIAQLRGPYIMDSYDDETLTPVPDYYRDGKCYIKTKPSGDEGPLFLSDKSLNVSFSMSDVAVQNADIYPMSIYVKVTPLRSDASPQTYSLKKKESGTYRQAKLKLPDNGAYVVTVFADENCTNEILMYKPLVLVKAYPFKENGGVGEEYYESCPDDNHPHLIDLGLPSGNKWACCNVGATTPEDYGLYFAWGETTGYTGDTGDGRLFNWASYKWCNGDAAHVNWGGGWRMPTVEQFEELINSSYTTTTWTTQNGVYGREITSVSNGNSIFLPATGYRDDSSLYDVGSHGHYWSRALNENYPDCAWSLGFYSSYIGMAYGNRFFGRSVRPVWLSEACLELSSSSLSLNSSADSGQVTITCNGSWTATSSEQWCTISPTSGTGDGILTISVSENTSTDSRSATVTVTADALTRTLTVTQDAHAEMEPVDLGRGLVAYYPFNGNANDESGNGNHGSIIGNVVLAPDRHGNSNSAYRFPGEPFNYISVPDDETLHCSTFTLNAWVFTDGDDYGSGYLINKGRDITRGSYRLYVRGVGAQNLYGGVNDAGVDEIPSVGVWHMITGTVEGDQARYYLDGVLMDVKTLSYPFSYSNSDPLTLGMHYYTSVPSIWAYPLLGVLDDVSIYNRALNQSEINALYEGAALRKPGSGTDSGGVR